MLESALTAATLIGLLWAAFGRRTYREYRTNRDFQRQFREDWMGEPGRPGVPARPGVMESLLEIRGGWAALTERLRKVETEVASLHTRIAAVEKTQSKEDHNA